MCLILAGKPTHYWKCWVVPVAIGVWSLSACPVQAQDGQSLQSRFLSEAPGAWKRYQEFWKTLQGVSDVEQRDNGKFTHRVRYSVKQCDGNRLDQIEMFTLSSYRTSAYVKNPRYHFNISRKGPDKPWVLVGVKPDDAKSQGIPCTGLTLHPPHNFLPDLIHSKEFRILDIAIEWDDGRELVRVRFEYTKDKDPLRGGWVILDPGYDWIIRKSTLDLTSADPLRARVFRIEHEYKEGSNRHPLLTKVFYHSRTIQEGRTTSEFDSTCKLDLYEQESVPDSEFMLCAFGLPEPVDLKNRGSRWYLWAAVAGVGCLVAGIVVRRFARRPV